MKQTSDPPDSDADLFPLLDRYVEQLQQGDASERDRVLSDHPELASAVRCLEALEKLAPSKERTSDLPSGLASIPTVPFSITPGDDATSRPHSSPAVPEGGLEFGDYLLQAEIGRGGMGVVYRARQKSLDRTVALKMILANHLASHDQIRRFHAEAKAAAGLSHPNIVNIFEAGQVHGQHYFAMSYVEGLSLSGRLERGRMDTEEALEMLATVARAVDHLHQHGIVHRDLKPGNILLDATGRPYVTDFGLAKMLRTESNRTATGVIAGTPSYMAPEQAGGHQKEIGPLCDVYSLGAILYELLTGQPPFRAESPLDTLIQVLEKEPARPRQLDPQVSRKLELICLKCLEKSPAKRYASAAALADDLERYLRHDELAVRPPSTWQRMIRWARRQPALATHLGALSAYYLVELYNYFGGSTPVELRFHLSMTAIVVVWAACSLLFQQLLQRPHWSTTAIFAWAGADSLLLLFTISLGNGLTSPLMVGYPLLIASAGLWYRVRLVWFAVFLSIASYAYLVFARYRDPELPTESYQDPAGHLFYVLGLVVVGAVTAYQVARIKALSQHYEHRRT